MRNRFTIDGSDELEARLEAICNEVRVGVRAIVPKHQLEAILLGGGYGRGEGGVLKTPIGDQPYNDLEYYVCMRGNRLLKEKRYRHTLHELGERLSQHAGIEVEFKIISAGELHVKPPTMFLYDLALGHKVIFGSHELFTGTEFDANDIPLSEATRLLMNRCSGLLFSQKRLKQESFTPEDADFVGRNQAKAQLAFGDVVLAAVGRYHWSCRERHQRLNEIAAHVDLQKIKGPPLAQILCHHAMGAEFKLHPQRKAGTRETFLPLQTELCALGLQLWLWLENLRLNRAADILSAKEPGKLSFPQGTECRQHFATAPQTAATLPAIKKQAFSSGREYAFSRLNKCPETNPVKNFAINLKRFGPRILLRTRRTRYPRERLFHSLSLLLWEPGTIHDPVLLKKVQRELHTTAGTFERLVAAYESIWRNFN